MSYSLSFRSEVEDDAISGYLWYEEKVTGLGEEFLRVFYAYAREIPQMTRMLASTSTSLPKGIQGFQVPSAQTIPLCNLLAMASLL